MGDDGFNSSYRCNRLGIREPGPIFGRSLILRLFYIGRGRRGDNERVAHISDPSYVFVKIGGGGGGSLTFSSGWNLAWIEIRQVGGEKGKEAFLRWKKVDKVNVLRKT